MKKTVLLILAGGALAIALVFVGWRLISRRHTAPCPSWLRWMVELDNPFTKTNRAAVILEHLRVTPGMTVLDVGCGPGRLTIPLAQAVGTHGHVTALDIQEGMLQRAREKAHAHQLQNIDFRQIGIGQGTLEQNHYDRALLVTVLGEIPDRESAFRELANTLKPGGILSVTEVIFDPHFQPSQTVRTLASTVGLHEVGFFGHQLAYTIHLQKPSTPQ